MPGQKPSASQSKDATMYDQFPPQGWATPFQAMQQQTQQNNAYANHVQSCERVVKTNEKVAEYQAINELSSQLLSVSIRPLPEEIEPEFPLPSSLSPPVRDFIETTSRFKGVYPPMVFAALLGAVFCAARGKFWLQISDHYRELLTGYVLISSPSGSRKTAVSQVLREVFKRQEAMMQRDIATVTPSPMEHRILSLAMQKMERKIRDDRGLHRPRTDP